MAGGNRDGTGPAGDVEEPEAWTVVPDVRVNPSLLFPLAEAGDEDMLEAGMFLSTSATYPYWDGTSVGLLGTFSDVDVRTANRLPGHLV